MTIDAQPYALIAPPCPLPLFSARLASIVQWRIVSNVELTALDGATALGLMRGLAERFENAILDGQRGTAMDVDRPAIIHSRVPFLLNSQPSITRGYFSRSMAPPLSARQFSRMPFRMVKPCPSSSDCIALEKV